MILHQISNSMGNYNYNTNTYNDKIWPIHFHGNYELVFSVRGTTQVTVDGISTCLSEGKFILISPYSTHSLNISKDTSTWIVVFSKDYIRDFANKYMFINFSVFECDRHIRDFLKINMIDNPNPKHYLLTACLNLVCDQCLKNGKYLTQSDNFDFIKSVIIYITDNMDNDINMKEVAFKLGYEYHYFSALFNKYFSMNFRSFVNILRVEQAYELLSQEYYSITDVCNKCGFTSIRNFNRVFKNLSGLTPSEYKNTKSRKEQ